MIERVISRTYNGGSCSQCEGEYYGYPYSDRQGYRVIREIEPGVKEPVNMCPDCFEEERQ